MDYLQKIIIDIELHSVAGISDCFENGISPNEMLNGKPLIYELINEYPRGPKFSECVQTFIKYGLTFDDDILLAVLANDAPGLNSKLTKHPAAINKKYSLNCTFTPLLEASLLHICAEYNHVSCAKILVKHGANVDEKAGLDEYGFGGQTPIFHTVNQHANLCLEMLNFLIDQKANLNHTVKGLIWGKGYKWETFIPSVNPISYSMMGLLRQFQRTEQLIYEVVTILMKAAYEIEYVIPNIPNAYLE